VTRQISTKGLWRPHARLPPAMLFSGRKDPRNPSGLRREAMTCANVQKPPYLFLAPLQLRAKTVIRAHRQALSCFYQGPSYVANTAEEVLHYGAYHSVFQRDDPDEPWLNRKIDRQYFEWGSVGAKAQHGTG
jgi:hypothetical protein